MAAGKPKQPRKPRQRAACSPGVILFVSDAAKLLGDTEKAIRQRVARREVPFRKLGGRVIFLRDELEAFFRGLPGCSSAEAQENVRRRESE